MALPSKKERLQRRLKRVKKMPAFGIPSSPELSQGDGDPGLSRLEYAAVHILAGMVGDGDNVGVEIAVDLAHELFNELAAREDL